MLVCPTTLKVQRLVFASFLGRRWQQDGPPLLASLPPSFVLEVLLPAAGQAHLWRGQDAEQLQQGMAAWCGHYAAAQPLSAQRQLLLALLELLGGGGCSSGAGATQHQQPQLQRPLVQTVSAALAAAAICLPVRSACGGSSEELQQWQLLFLLRLQEASSRLGASWGSGGSTGSYAVSVCSGLLQAATAVATMPAADAGGSSASQAVLAAVGAWLQQLPLSLLLPGAALHSPAAAWASGAGQQQLLLLLTCCVHGYMEHGDMAALEGQTAATAAADWAAWQQQAGGLVRLALLLSCSDQPHNAAAPLSAADLEAAFSSWFDALGALYRR